MAIKTRSRLEAWQKFKKTLETLMEPKNVLLLGNFGAGKSSFINTAITSITGEYDHYVDVGCGSKHNTTQFKWVSRDDYWIPEDEEDKGLNLPSFIDIIGLDPQLSTAEEEETVNSQIIELVIHGKIPENSDLLHLGKILKEGKELKDYGEDNTLAVDAIIVVISAEKSSSIPQTLIDEIYREANTKKKKIPVFAVLTKTDICGLTGEELEKKKTEVCEAIGIKPNKMLTCSNYQPDQTPDADKDNAILQFLRTLCNPRFKAVTLHKMEFVEREPEPIPSPPENSFGKTLLMWAVFILVIAVILGAIYNLIVKYSQSSDLSKTVQNDTKSSNHS